MFHSRRRGGFAKGSCKQTGVKPPGVTSGGGATPEVTSSGVGERARCTGRVRFAISIALSLLGVVAAAPFAFAAPQAVEVDRVIVRFTSPETGGVDTPRFVLEHVLKFEARLEALADPDFSPTETRPYLERHVEQALERHIGETLLASLRIEPAPNAEQLSRQMESARLMLVQRVGGLALFRAAQRAESIGAADLRDLLQRRARASFYLDRMVAPMLSPSDAELSSLHRAGQTPYAEVKFERARTLIRRWYVARRLSEAVQSFFQNARSRIHVTYLAEP